MPQAIPVIDHPWRRPKNEMTIGGATFTTRGRTAHGVYCGKDFKVFHNKYSGLFDLCIPEFDGAYVFTKGYKSLTEAVNAMIKRVKDYEQN